MNTCAQTYHIYDNFIQFISETHNRFIAAVVDISPSIWWVDPTYADNATFIVTDEAISTVNNLCATQVQSSMYFNTMF